MLILVVCVLAAVWAVAMMTAPGRVGYVYFYMYSEFYMGVLALVALSITIMIGLVATDRLVLSIRQRVLLQSAHRTTGLIAVTSLALHVWTKIAESHISVIDIFIPFLNQGNRLYVGFGTISGWIMVLVMWTGIARSRFIGRGKPWMWRSIHAISYLMWPIALVHGLAAGRAAKTWVIVSYIVCILAVLIGLAVRLSVSMNRNKDFSSSAGAALKPVGNMVPTASPVMKKPRRREPEPEPQTLGPVAVVDSFQPAAAPPPPVSERAELVAPAGPPPRQRRAAIEDEIEYDEPAPRGRRYAGEDTSTRMRRADFEDTGAWRRAEMDDTFTGMRRVEMDDTSTRMRRVEMDDTSTRMRRVEMDDTSGRLRRIEAGDFDEPAPRSRRRAAPEPMPMPTYDDAPRGRRRAEPGYDEVPRQRGAGRYEDDRRSARYEPRFGEEAEEAPRARRDRGADVDRADSGRHSRTGFVDLADDDDELPTLVDMASRRAMREQQDPGRGQVGRGARRGGRGRADDDVTDDRYWSQLRGEAN
ncbi:ferric reductase-like transmembrane domain-containing protein [Actinoplanes subtropicus]|uniref:ferric reductase-like transmembrane domain-containing protein n=1 Tax=Actinoplanes subtropicus TaxID=543632 RepID=UPI000A02FC2E|nr:ferric reductase-like transmembrane domain-containing protein [Actinoplanes subtropicus]